ncbi:transcriptional regulator, GntR family [Enterococcus faecium]|nr:transcriptional regulator, GntR family [Enterococcus faecium]
MVAHDKLPSERELTSFYGVSRTTVRLALQELEKMGYIYRQHGKGTFVSELRTNATDLAGAYSFTEQCGQWANILKPRYWPSRRLKQLNI